jgi:molecular chaperone DnaK
MLLESILENSSKKEILRNALKPFAEKVKIQLSFKEEETIFPELDETLPFD